MIPELHNIQIWSLFCFRYFLPYFRQVFVSNNKGILVLCTYSLTNINKDKNRKTLISQRHCRSLVLFSNLLRLEFSQVGRRTKFRQVLDFLQAVSMQPCQCNVFCIVVIRYLDQFLAAYQTLIHCFDRDLWCSEWFFICIFFPAIFVSSAHKML